jgi:hypothetical protein
LLPPSPLRSGPDGAAGREGVGRSQWKIKGLTAQRRALLIRLAAALEEDAPLPVADAEDETARKAQSILAQRECRSAEKSGPWLPGLSLEGIDRDE